MVRSDGTSMTIRLLVVSLVSIGCVASAQAPTTIPEAVARFGPEPIYRARTAELVRYPFEHLVRTVDLIVCGSVTVSSTYMSPDQLEIFTDYSVTPTSIVANRQTVPGTPLIKKWGGVLTVEGVEVRFEDSNVPALPTGTSLVLLLKSNADGTFRLPTDGPGVFEIRDSKVYPMMTPPLDGVRFEGLALASFLATVQAAWAAQ
jgi:hypothetical protein